MFIPALLAMRHDQGYTAYAIEPELQEVLDARTGQLTSKRTERVTYVFEGSGEFELPGLTLRWWNTNSKNVEIASVSAIRATVLGGPVNISGGADDVQDLDRAALLWAVVLVVGVFSIVALIASFRSRVNAWWQKHIAAWQASESFAFRQLSRAVARRDAHQIYEALAIWLDRWQQGLTWDQVAHQADDPAVTPLRRLSAGLFDAGHSSAPPLDRQARGELKRTLNRIRFEYRRMSRPSNQKPALALLNPQLGQS